MLNLLIWEMKSELISISFSFFAFPDIFLSFMEVSLKFVPAIFYQIYIFSLNDSPSKTMKNVFYFI